MVEFYNQITDISIQTRGKRKRKIRYIVTLKNPLTLEANKPKMIYIRDSRIEFRKDALNVLTYIFSKKLSEGEIGIVANNLNKLTKCTAENSISLEFTMYHINICIMVAPKKDVVTNILSLQFDEDETIGYIATILYEGYSLERLRKKNEGQVTDE